MVFITQKVSWMFSSSVLNDEKNYYYFFLLISIGNYMLLSVIRIISRVNGEVISRGEAE